MDVHDEDGSGCVSGLREGVEVAKVESGIAEREAKVSARVMVGQTVLLTSCLD
jgi:uncharacterized protein YheU (UPF0270 family)